MTFSKGLYQYNPTFDVDGLVFWKDISHLPRGPHILSTYRLRESQDTSYFQRIARMEFYKDSPRLQQNRVVEE